MSSCTKIRSNGEICGRPCASGQAKDRCSKHKGLDPEETPKETLASPKESKETKTFKKEKAPKPGSKKWQVQQGLISGGGDSKEIIEKNPYSICAIDLDFYPKKIDTSGRIIGNIFDVLSNYPSKFILKGTPIYTSKIIKVQHSDYSSEELDYVFAYSDFKIEILESKTHNGKGNWGNVEVPVVKTKEELSKPKASTTTMSINTCVVKIEHILSKISEKDTFDSLFDNENKKVKEYNYFPDFTETSEKISERDILLYNAGHNRTFLVSNKYKTDYELIDLSHLSDEALAKLHEIKLKFREPYGESFTDDRYIKFLLSKYSVEKQVSSMDRAYALDSEKKVAGENDY